MIDAIIFSSSIPPPISVVCSKTHLVIKTIVGRKTPMVNPSFLPSLPFPFFILYKAYSVYIVLTKNIEEISNIDLP